MQIILLAVLAAIAALFGGLVAFKARSKINQALGFTAGIILGLVAFDLLPEIFEIVKNQGLDPIWPMIALVVGFLSFHTIEKFILVHNAHETDYTQHQHPHIGVAGAIAFCSHSFLDGMSIGIAFQISPAVGLLVSIAVIGHRFADGFNTTNIMLYHKNKPKDAFRMLIIASLMPILGAVSSLFFDLPEAALAIYLGFFAGFLLYIGASDILPQAHSKGSSKTTIALTTLGAVFMFVIIQFAV